MKTILLAWFLGVVPQSFTYSDTHDFGVCYDNGTIGYCVFAGGDWTSYECPGGCVDYVVDR